MLPRPRRHLDDRECCCRAQGATPGRRASSGGRSECETVGARGISEGEGNIGSADYDRAGGHVGTLPTAPAPMVPGQEDVGHGLGREGGEVPDVLHPRDGLLYLLECVRLVPYA